MCFVSLPPVALAGSITWRGSTEREMAGTSSSGYVSTLVDVATTATAGGRVCSSYPSTLICIGTCTSGGGQGRITSLGAVGSTASPGMLTVYLQQFSPALFAPSSVALQPLGIHGPDGATLHFTGTAGVPAASTLSEKLSPATTSLRSARTRS